MRLVNGGTMMKIIITRINILNPALVILGVLVLLSGLHGGT